MNKYYKTDHLTFNEKIQALKDAKEKCFEWWVDELVGWQRNQIEISFEDILEKFKDDSNFIITLRDNMIEGMYFEGCFRELNYFFWTKLIIKHEDYFVKNYKLKEYEE